MIGVSKVRREVTRKYHDAWRLDGFICRMFFAHRLIQCSYNPMRDAKYSLRFLSIHQTSKHQTEENYWKFHCEVLETVCFNNRILIMTFGNQIGFWPQHTDCSQLFRLVNPIKRFTFIQIQQLSIAEMCQKRLLSTSKSIKTINLLVLINDWNNIDRPFNYHDNRAYEAKL